MIKRGLLLFVLIMTSYAVAVGDISDCSSECTDLEMNFVPRAIEMERQRDPGVIEVQNERIERIEKKVSALVKKINSLSTDKKKFFNNQQELSKNYQELSQWRQSVVVGSGCCGCCSNACCKCCCEFPEKSKRDSGCCLGVTYFYVNKERADGCCRKKAPGCEDICPCCCCLAGLWIWCLDEENNCKQWGCWPWIECN